MIYQGKDSTSIIFVLAIFAAVSFKLLPSVNKMFTFYQQINYYGSSFDKIFNELESLNSFQLKEAKNKLRLKKSIKINELSFNYSQKQVLENIDFQINKGEIIGIIGKSGSGKSTLVNILTGLINPNSGSVLIDDVNIKEDMISFQSIIGYVSQSVVLLDESIKKNIAFELDDNKIDLKKVNDVIKQVELSEWVNNLDNGLETQVGEQGVQISGGQRQRLGIASIIYKSPEVMIFDEPTSSLDEETESKILKLISNLKGYKTIIIISHKASKL